MHRTFTDVHGLGLSFTLDPEFVEQYSKVEPEWGFGALSEATFLRSYSRTKDRRTGTSWPYDHKDLESSGTLENYGGKERWWEVVERVINGMYSIQKDHMQRHNLPWDDDKAQRSAQEAFERMFEFKWTPSGRGLWCMGSYLVNGRNDSSPLYSCFFVSTKDIDKDFAAPFTFLMSASMKGGGVGFDTKGAGKLRLVKPKGSIPYRIPDSSSGWVKSVELVLRAFTGGPMPHFGYDLIRDEGEPIITFGGIAPGPEPLKKLHETLTTLLQDCVDRGGEITTKLIADIFNLIGVAVVSGNVRRSSEISFGEWDDAEFWNMKDYTRPDNQYRSEWGWMSNNSVKVYDNTTPDFDAWAEKVARGYNKVNAGAGEPGLFFIDNARNYGRMNNGPDFADVDIEGANPCAEIGLEHGEACVSFDTRIQTRTGTPKIGDVVGVPVEVWNGGAWSLVMPRITGHEQKLYRVTLSDGSHVDVTSNHRWSIKRGSSGGYGEVTTNQLIPGMRTEPFTLSGAVEGSHEPFAYDYGFIAGDGFVDGPAVRGVLFEDFDDFDSPVVFSKWHAAKEDGTKPFRYVRFPHLNRELAGKLRSYDGLPEEVFSWSVDSIREFLAGYIDTDGTVQRNPNNDYYRVYGSEAKVRDLLLLARRAGIDGVSIRCASEKGVKTNKGVRKHGCWYLSIHSYECEKVRPRRKFARAALTTTATNNAYPASVISTKRVQKVASIEELSGLHTTYCFDESEYHKGVFGNVLTHQCNLVEQYAMRHEDVFDFLRTGKYAYLYAKTVTLLPTMWPETNAVQLKNRRIGVSITGTAHFVDVNGYNVLQQWVDEGYREIRKWDKLYSEWLCVRESKKVTTSKPSGTVSLVAGTTAGVHWPTSSHYIRRVTFPKDSPLLTPLRNAGYRTEFSAYSPETSVVVEFPNITEGVRSEEDVSVFEKIALIAHVQKWWADNMVSNTINFDPETEIQDLANAMKVHASNLKSVSALPRATTAYKQLPEERVNPEYLLYYAASLKPVDFSDIYDGVVIADDAVRTLGCDSDACEINYDVTTAQ